MILFSTMFDQNSNNEDVDGDTVIHDGEGADGERVDGERADGESADGERAGGERADGDRADGERADVESAKSDDSGTEPQGQVQGLFLLLSKVIFFVEDLIFIKSYYRGCLLFTEA